MVGHTSAHPPLPPTQEDERLDWLRLLRSRRVGIATFTRLLREHGSARAAIKALPAMARAAGVDDYRPCPEGVALAEYRAGLAQGARLLLRGEAAYPPLLALLPDAPPLLWALGDTSLLVRPMVAVIGTRNGSSLGLRMARRLAEGLGEAGLAVVSGLARGIDTEAHRAALPTGTVAVMPGGVDHIYPPENRDLAEEIARRGLRLSEHPFGLEPQVRHFPARNRIVSGLSHGVVVVEAAERSGSLITARMAADQGREVLAVPGHPMDPRAAGCNHLIRDGATLVRSVEDILEALGPALEQSRVTQAGQLRLALEADTAPVRDMSPASAGPAASGRGTDRPTQSRGGHVEEARRPAGPDGAAPAAMAPADLRTLILGRLGPSPVAEDQVIRDLGGQASVLAPALTDLELDGLIVRHPGGLLALSA
ncbi:DNA-processing protein DprA [Rubellimicrobium arenae]|uniref:DNA-processing protein DprA n=1 Tax=Rubellimicrobium arenae TaxID=2817372 RepID=UPI001B3048E3|nr:DNA-processing protein DprA [Rubellimicrobium arenae]